MLVLIVAAVGGKLPRHRIHRANELFHGRSLEFEAGAPCSARACAASDTTSRLGTDHALAVTSTCIGSHRPVASGGNHYYAATPSGGVPCGIARRTTGCGFSYVATSGRRISSRALRGRIDALAAPPDWKHMWIASDQRAHIRATSVYVAGRTQYPHFIIRGGTNCVTIRNSSEP
ncbi:hypothetical protein [Arthrobacter psychrolactophilus]|uniref:hypothetical protein n=1 Tax=Arthrobacter psychrolactophilus TaxID=92442 RepID=UPI003522862C